MGLIVEICGVTGSGKTSLANRILDVLEREKIVFGTNTRSHFVMAGLSGRWFASESTQNIALEVSQGFRALQLPMRPFTRACIERIGSAKMPLGMKISCVRSLARKLGVYQYARSQLLLHIIDEGPCQLLHNILVSPEHSPDEEELNWFAENVPLPDLLLMVSAPAEVALERTIQRPDPPRKLGQSAMLAFISNANTAYKNLACHPRIRSVAASVSGDDLDSAMLAIRRVVSIREVNRASAMDFKNRG